MKWNWTQQGWPEFRFDASRLVTAAVISSRQLENAPFGPCIAIF